MFPEAKNPDRRLYILSRSHVILGRESFGYRKSCLAEMRLAGFNQGVPTEAARKKPRAESEKR